MKKLIWKLALAYLGQLCVPWRHQKLQCRTSVDSRVLSSSVASQRLTLNKMASDHELYKNLWTSPPITVPRMHTHVSHAYTCMPLAPRVSTLVPFIIVAAEPLMSNTIVHYKIQHCAHTNLHVQLHTCETFDVIIQIHICTMILCKIQHCAQTFTHTCCFALFVCLFDFACFFLPSFSSLIKTCMYICTNTYMYLYVYVYTCTYCFVFLSE